MKRLFLFLFLAISVASCKCQDYIEWVQSDIAYVNSNYGLLYNWHATQDARGLSSSSDWRVPIDSDVTTLFGVVGHNTPTLKENSSDYWTTYIGNTNTYGFNGRGSGRRTSVFALLKNYLAIWTSSSISSYGNSFEINTIPDGNFYKDTARDKYIGNSIRLLYTGAGTPTEYVGNDLKHYRIIQVGSQWWMSENLQETKYKNGDWIDGYNGGVYAPISNANWAAKSTGAVCVYNDLDENR